MLTAYREDGQDWRGDGADFPDHIIWIDLLDPTPEEQKLVEARAKIRMPSKDALSEIEASSRLVVQHGVLTLSTPMVAKSDAGGTEISPAGFVLTRNLLVTVRFKQLPPFDSVADRVHSDDTLDCSVGIFTALLEAIVDRGADVLEQLAATTDKVSKSIFHAGASDSKHPTRSTARLHEILTEIGINANRLAQARDSLLGAGRLADFVSEIAHDWIPEPFAVRLHAVSKDVASLTDYETHLTDKVQFLLDATLGYISVEQNDIFKVLTIVSVIGIPPTLLAGIWGMNFKTMPELNWAWGYPLAWLAIILSAVLPLLWLKRRGWF